MEQKRRKDYTAVDLVKVAKRDNNKIRPYLLVNPLQGKHVPVAPRKSLELFESLTTLVSKAMHRDDGCVLVLGFAETATAIGAAVALGLSANFKKRTVYALQTTRENVKGAEYLFFSESHSHATNQKIVKDGMDSVAGVISSIIIVEDEVTTGNTIKGLLREMKEAGFLGHDPEIIISSILNGMTEEAETRFREEGIKLVYIEKTDNEKMSQHLQKYKFQGERKDWRTKAQRTPQGDDAQWEHIVVKGEKNMRKLCKVDDLARSIRELTEKVQESLIDDLRGQSVVVIGTEECMYPALAVGKSLENSGINVLCHSTTRSPILPSKEVDYPLHRRDAIDSFYEKGRTTYIYDLTTYDFVIIITDGRAEQSESLIKALKYYGNRRGMVVTWIEE